MRRWLTILIWLLVVALTAALAWAMTIGWRPAEFQDIYGLRPEVRMDWARDFDRSIDRFVEQVGRGEPFTFTLSQEAINGVLAHPLEFGKYEGILARHGLREPQVACRDGWLLLMARSDAAGGAVVSVTVRATEDRPGWCRLAVGDAHIGSVPLDRAFIDDKLASVRHAQDAYQHLHDEVAARNPGSAAVGNYERLTNTYRTLATAGRGDPLPLWGRLGEGLCFVIDRVELREGAIVLHVRPVPERGPAQPSSAEAVGAWTPDGAR